MGVRDVAPGHRNARLLHLREVAERVLRQRSVEAWETTASEGILDRLAFRVVHADVAVRLSACHSVHDRGVDVLRAVERLVTGVTVGLIRELVRARVGDVGRIRSTDPSALGAVDGDSHVVGQRCGTGGGSRRRGIGGGRVVPLRRARAEGLRHVAERSRAGVLELDVCE